MKLDAATSSTFSVARVLCITLMITTHLWPGESRILGAELPRLWQVAFSVIVDHLGRASVPLLSLISGILFVATFERVGNGRKVMVGKIRTLIVPMALWSIPALLLLAMKSLVVGGSIPWPRDLAAWVNTFLAISTAPANAPLHFLREIFVMCCYGTLIMFVVQRARWTAPLLIALILMIEVLPGSGVLFRWPIGPSFWQA